MSRSYLYKSMCAVAALFICSMAYAQGTGSEVWKKKVARVIDIAEKEDTTQHTKRTHTDSTLLELLMPAIKTGKLIAYSNIDNNFATKLSQAHLAEMTSPKVDTMIIVDPVSGNELVKTIHRDFNYDAIHKYRLLEDWTFDPQTGKTEIQITGIAPLKEIYGDDGIFRGVQAMFWVRYADVETILAGYDRAHPNSAFTTHIWADNFIDSIAPGNTWHARAALLIDLSQKEDNASHHLNDVLPDTTIYSTVVAAIKAGQVPANAGADDRFTTNLAYDSLRKKIGLRTDTIMVINPAANVDEMKIVSHGFEYDDRHTFYLLEEWKFDKVTGKTEVEITGLAPEREVKWGKGEKSYSREEAIFWVRYTDIRSLLAHYEQYHPDNTIAAHVLSSYFLSDVKPVVIK